MATKNNEDLFTRAATAAHQVTTLTADLKTTRDRLAKAKAEARSLKKQVWEALGGKPRKSRKVTRKESEAAIAAMRDPTPVCWFQGCGKDAVKAVSDFEGKTWECCADHTIASREEDAGGPL